MPDPRTERTWWPKRLFKRGGNIAGKRLVLLSPGEELIDPERARQLGLTADARRMEREHLSRDMANAILAAVDELDHHADDHPLHVALAHSYLRVVANRIRLIGATDA